MSHSGARRRTAPYRRTEPRARQAGNDRLRRKSTGPGTRIFCGDNRPAPAAAHLLRRQSTGPGGHWLGAGAVIAGRLLRCTSGRELEARGYTRDVELAAEHDVSDVAPRLAHGAYVR